jgi:hypothetical protein
MAELPPEDRPDEIWVGPVGPIPIIDEDDPRFEAERAAWSAATTKAQALHSADELLEGVRDSNWRVRFESVPRLVARWKNDPRTLPRLLDVVANDPTSEVRAAAVMEFLEFDPDDVATTLGAVVEDEDADVRWTAAYVGFQLGLSDEPPPGFV